MSDDKYGSRSPKLGLGVPPIPPCGRGRRKPQFHSRRWLTECTLRTITLALLAWVRLQLLYLGTTGILRGRTRSVLSSRMSAGFHHSSMADSSGGEETAAQCWRIHTSFSPKGNERVKLPTRLTLQCYTGGRVRVTRQIRGTWLKSLPQRPHRIA